ncbi:putative amidoligase domain-containing protein [Paenibacillus sp. KN14-4R]|uniref:putative amidoligase domain-containing protein n=1 Tax=Paenibacillus sp. KN14-4R TaxID=3445773 RepID=UPI003F9F490B
MLHSNEKELEPLLPLLTIPNGDRLPVAFKGGTIIGWGKYRKVNHIGTEKCVQLQLLMPVIRCMQPLKRDEILQLHGVKTLRSHGKKADENGSNLPHLFRVSVFGLEALSVYQRKNRGMLSLQGGLREPIRYEEVNIHDTPRSYHVNRAIREAVKAIYVLGLDYGDVRVGVTASGHTVILDVNPEADLTLACNAENYANAMNRYTAAVAEEEKGERTLLLGADPEFLLMNERGKIVAASHYMERTGEVGCDAIVLSGHRVILPLAELRPEPSTQPRELVRNLRKTMLLASQMINDPSLRWIAGGMPVKGFALGGHIHFSGVMLQSDLLRALDNYLALPLLLIENDQDQRRRPRYGWLGDFRRQPHGGFEYRTLASWLSSPTVTKGVVALAKLIGENYRLLKVRPLDQIDIQRMFYQGKKEQLVGVVSRLWKELENLSSYELYSTYLDPLKERVLNRRELQSQHDFRIPWKIKPNYTFIQ